LYALSPTLALSWSYVTGGGVSASPAIASNGTVYFGSEDGYLYAVHAPPSGVNGVLNWRANEGTVDASPAVGGNGLVYIGTSQGIAAVADHGATSTNQWLVPTSKPVFGSPAIGADGTLYVGDQSGTLRAITSGGSVLWQYQPSTSLLQSSPAIDANGTLYVGSYDAKLYAFAGSPAATPTPTATSTLVPGAGSLVGSSAVAPATVDLSSQGTLDWADWGLNDATSFDHKATVPALLPTYTLVSGGPVGRASVPTQFTWTDGTPDPGASSGAGLFSPNLGHGFALAIPADPTSRTLHLYVGVHNAQGSLTGSLSDGSAPPYTDRTLDNPYGTTIEEYTFSYHAGSPGQTLHLSYTLTTNYGFGYITLEAASLS
jgi:hypothetical protein